MSDFENAVAGTVDDAVTWAGESTRLWLDTYVRLVDAAATRSVTADACARDLSALVAAGARDMARASATWVALGTAMLQLDITDPNPPSGEGTDDAKAATGEKAGGREGTGEGATGGESGESGGRS